MDFLRTDQGQGGTQAQGHNGWSPVLGIEVLGDKQAVKVTDWVGGTPPKPAINVYLGRGSTGFADTIGEAADIVPNSLESEPLSQTDIEDVLGWEGKIPPDDQFESLSNEDIENILN